MHSRMPGANIATQIKWPTSLCAQVFKIQNGILVVFKQYTSEETP